MHLTTGLIALVAAPLMFFFLRESTRWLIVNGRLEEAERQLREAAKVNGRELDEEERRKMNGNY